MEALFVSIIGGVIIYVAGQFLMKAVVEPAIELKKQIGLIAHDLDYYANQMYGDMPKGDEARDAFRKHACTLREKLAVVLWYDEFRHILQLPPMNDVFEATGSLIGQSNFPTKPTPGFDFSHEKEIKRLLGIRG